MQLEVHASQHDSADCDGMSEAVEKQLEDAFVAHTASTLEQEWGALGINSENAADKGPSAANERV